MKTSPVIFVCTLALALAGCSTGSDPLDTTAEPVQTRTADVEPEATGINIIAARSHFRIFKVCDEGRAIYSAINYNDPGGLAVVENAPECKKPAK